MQKKALIITALLALAAALVGGCGGSSSSATPSKQDFVKEADFICNKELQRREEALQQINSEVPSKTKATSVAFREKAVRKVMAVYEEATEKLGELQAPKGDEKTVEAIVAAREEAAQRVLADPETALKSSIPFKKSDELAKAYGLEKCVI